MHQSFCISKLEGGDGMEKYYEKELLEELHDIQETYGFISEEDILRISQKRDIPKARLYGVISFYSMFHLEPTGKYIVRVCDSVSCRLNESTTLVKALKDYLKVEENETTKDKKFTYINRKSQKKAREKQKRQREKKKMKT